MRLSFFIVSGFLVILLFFDCKGIKKQRKMQDDFYTRSNASWDASRLPLVRPYELLRLNGSKEWEMNLRKIPGSVSNIKEVSVFQNIIMIHSGETYCNNAKVEEAWFVIIPEKDIEKGFEKKEGYDKYLSLLHVISTLYNADTVYGFFQRNKKINWQEYGK
jgi:hypothetical protein